MNKVDRTFQHLTRLAAHLARQDETWHSVPYHLEFAPNNLCNLRCLMCDHNRGIPPVHMAEEDTVQVLDQLLPQAGLITPSALSEPLLSGIERITAKCVEHDCWLNIITNGSLLTPQRLELMDACRRCSSRPGSDSRAG